MTFSPLVPGHEGRERHGQSGGEGRVAALQGLAVQLHRRRGETSDLWLNYTLIGVTVLVAALSAYVV